MNLDLRNALIAKTTLRDNYITKEGLILTSFEEASNLKKSKNLGYHNHNIIKLRTIKIFKNLLKYYKIDDLVKILDTSKPFKLKLKSKNEIIEHIIYSSYFIINTIGEK